MNPGQAARLREALLDAVEAIGIEVEGTAKAAVLVALQERHGDLFALFTRRRDDLRQHAGQISFPGGRFDPTDADLVATALREATEEVGLPTDSVTLLGALEPVSIPVSGFALYPFVAAIVRPAAWIPAPGEVEEILELSLRELSATYALRSVRRGEHEIVTPTYTAGEHVIWGATARVLGDLLARIGPL